MLNFKYFKNLILFFVRGIISKFNFKLFITAVCLLFLGNSIYGNFEALANQKIAMKEIIWLFWSLIFSFLSIVINGLAWKFLIESIGCNNEKLNIIKIFINTNIYKYLPGGIWHFVSRYNILKRKIPIEKSVECILLEPLLMLVAGLFFIPFGNFSITIAILCWSSTLLFLRGFREFIIKYLKIIKLSVFINSNKVDELNLVENVPNFSTRLSYPYLALFVEIVFVLFRFFGFLCCINAFSIGSLISIGQLISFFCFAWIVGLVIPAAPGGLGVFESVILFSLGSKLPEAPLLASLLCYRLMSTLSDIFGALVYPLKGLFLKFRYNS
tara:strand:- start:636 stop:1616 length:981 start_codon:yes stop_codon:yes gene_type:complete